MQTTRTTRLQPTPIPFSSKDFISGVRTRQYMYYWPMQLFSRTILRSKAVMLLQPEDIDPSFHYVLASNHQSGVDPFVICTSMPLSLWRKLGTFRFFTRTDLFGSPLLRGMLISSGAFAATVFRDLPYGVEAARAFLGRGQTVLIFPEGRRTLPGVSRVRHGVQQLGEDPMVRVIPVRIQWHTGFGRSFQLTVGRPLAAGQTAEAVLEAIYNLKLPQA